MALLGQRYQSFKLGIPKLETNGVQHHTATIIWSFGKSRWFYTPAFHSSDVGSPDTRQLSALLRASP
ncbi:hypothetical protein, partial [Pseudaminobacter soli (ex Li et al. 2025)]|uniref:hypothetical protein n=1 Tax=Pseudaminobacter soli (ex Li et al. 2025) TaxID=1295366 RepID=UPI001AECE527